MHEDVDQQRDGSIQMSKQKSWMLLFALSTRDEKLTLFILCLIFYS